MVAPANASPPMSSESNRLSALWKRFIGKDQRDLSPPAPCSEPGLSRDSSISSGIARRVSRKVIPGLPRVKTFRRQQSENRDKLEAFLPTPAERRAVSVDRRMQAPNQLLPRASAPDFFDDTGLSASKLAALSQTASAPQSPIDEKHYLSLNGIDDSTIVRDDDHTEEQVPTYPQAISTADAGSIDTTQYDALVREELEKKWILNLSMHFRDKSRREKFFVTYREKDLIWRRVTISLDYRTAPSDSLERDLINTKFQRDKSAKIYEAIRESLQDIQFYDTVTNLKLQTADGRLHVHVVEDVNEIIDFPTMQMVQHLDCRRVRESDLEFDSHMSGFVYKVRINGHTLIKKEIPGPDTIEEFLYEVNALNSLQFSRNIIEFYGIVVDDDEQVVKGLLINYADKGALIDVIYDSQEHGDQALPWAVREKWARQIVQGLSDIHETGFVQGDFTLSNIVIDNSDNARIIDINRRGCPVGWEPPEASPLVETHQRIAMYIGVKSDLYQLGMVLWALATLEDEPEHHRPLRLKPELDVPSWYREVVETCLHENPRCRLHAISLLEKFPRTLYDGVYAERLFPSISAQDGTSFPKYVARENFGLPEIRNSWPSVSNSQATSPSVSDEQDYPRRGRSPPSPLPTHHDLYQPRVSVNATWEHAHDIAALDDDPTADEARVVTPGDLEDTTDLMSAKMLTELDQMEASFRTVTGLEDEQMLLPGGDSPAQDISLKSVVEPLAVSESQNEDVTLLTENEPEDPTPIHDLTSGGNSDELPVAETRQSDKVATAEGPLEHAETTENPGKDNEVGVVAPLVDEPLAVPTAAGLGGQTESTKVSESRRKETPVDHLGADLTHDRTGDETEDISTRPTEATVMTKSDSAPRKDSLPAEPSERTDAIIADEKTGAQSPPENSDESPSTPTTEATQNTDVTA
ncbi:hypothetical protein O1611_g4106 [Lasiodiplodia mahajangana]|uniref:Uncharacterized protein n=1 Tax=Lasiodiplodia mahajangana TaxID=1108764 RepID=A0ACC2JPV7_9PEZI|nr:hypothetical protein O1611_g4106 [Lasiodiplodia mahajangana]